MNPPSLSVRKTLCLFPAWSLGLEPVHSIRMTYVTMELVQDTREEHHEFECDIRDTS